jgi:hypothetical protein
MQKVQQEGEMRFWRTFSHAAHSASLFLNLFLFTPRLNKVKQNFNARMMC